MGLTKNNPEKGNMYEFVTLMYSPIRGKCKHECTYCYVIDIAKRYNSPQKDLFLDEKDLRKNLGSGETVFVCYTCDLFADDVPAEWIDAVLTHLNKYPDNRYLLQSKNPARMLDFSDLFPPDVLLGTTIETNRTTYYESKAPTFTERAEALAKLNKLGYETMVTIEPLMDFDLEPLVDLIVTANPVWVNVGADSKGHDLPEPSPEKVKALIDTLKEKTDVELKRNIDRILEDMKND
jgi:DNA repair photolyase